MSNKFNKLSVFLSSTFTTSSILGISIGIPLYLNSKNTQNVDIFSNSNKIKNNESNQIIFNNNILNKLNNDIIGYINSNKLSYLDFEECLMDESKLNEFKSNLVKWSNDLLTLESIGDINLTQNNNNIKLNISSKLEYKFICENNSQYFDSSNSCLVFSNLDLYKDLSFNNKNISDFKSKLQEQINTNKYTNNEFKSFVESSEFKDFVIQNLKLISGAISQDNIGNISFDINKNELSIQPSGNYKFLLNYQSVESIIISNFNFYNEVKLINLSNLYNSIKNQIIQSKFTNDEFAKYVQSNISNIKQLISRNLYINENTTISISEIGNISVENGNLIINLNPNSNTKYTIDQNNDFSIENNVLTIKNLIYFKIVKIVKLSELITAIQNVIYNQNLSESEFERYVQINNIDFKDTIVQNLYISESITIDSNSISNISYNNSTLNIELLSDDYSKYEIDSSDNVSLNNNTLSISNLNYYSVINLTKLDNLYSVVQNKINTEKFSIKNLNDYISNSFDEFRNIIASNLYISSNQTINADNINGISLNNKNLEITLISSEHQEYSISNTNNISLVNNTLVLSNLNFWDEIKLSDLEQVYDSIQSLIDEYEFSNTQFSNYLNTNQDEIRELIYENLWIESTSNFSSNFIASISYLNDELKLNLISQQNIKYVIEQNSNFELVDNILTIKNLKYFSVISLSNLDNLHSAIQTKISDNQLSSDNFSSYIKSNQQEIKQLIFNNLWISNNTSIPLNKIDSILVDKNSNLVVSLVSEINTKFSISTNSNFVLNDNLLIIKNFVFNEVINFTRLNDLYNAVNNKIKSKNFSASDFNTYVSSNQGTIKQLVANNLYISSTNKFDVSNITSVSMSGNNLVVMLNSNIKYSADTYSDVVLINNVLTISNLYYSQTINLTKLDVLWTAINSYIAESNRKYTLDEFRNVINSSPSTIKQLVKDNLYINTSTTIALDKISSVTINENNQFEITLDTTLTKYTISAYTNAELNSNKLIIKNLNYFNLISINDTNLNNLRTSIQNYITNNKVTVDNVNSHITNINNLVSSVKTTDNQNLGNFVGSVTYSNNSFTIPLNGNYKMNVKSLSNIKVNLDSILMSNFNFWGQQSPEGWFTWNGTQITGLTTEGLKQKNIVLPSKATSITNGAFYNNKTLVSVDMSLTKITSIPGAIQFSTIDGSFASCSNLVSVSLPTTLTSIENSVFKDCPNLNSITIPDSVTSIGYAAFWGCTSLTSITLSNLLTSLENNTFYNCTSLTSITIPDGGDLSQVCV